MNRTSPAGAYAGSGDVDQIAFATFTLDLRSGQLLTAGTAVPLRPKTWAVLLHLAQRPGTLVSRDELLDAVWPDVAVTPDTLTKSIGELRIALGDDPRAPRFIETVHRRGFRFLVAPSSPAGGIDEPPPDAPPFVGREAELRRLHECLARADRGERQLVFLSGPPGVGKTALVEAFLRSRALRDSTARVTRGASIEQHGMREAYMPVLEALERLARGVDADHVLAAMRATAPTWLVQIPWLAQQEPGLMQRAFQAARPERMLREAIAMSEALAADATLVIVLEDLHWSDPSTIDLLTRAAQRREPARLLVVVTYRPAEVAAHDHPLGLAVRALRGQRSCVALPLGELSASAVDDYLAARFVGATPPATLGATLHARSDGNPLFLRALVDHMVAQGWILDTAPGWSFDAMPTRPDFGVPDDARDMVALQIGRLAPADRRLLEAASVAGRDVTVALLATVLDRSADEAAASAEAMARGERFLRTVAAPPATHYRFAHELYCQAVYREISSDRRQRLHLRIGTALETAHGDGAADIAPELSLHFELGGDLDRALHYLGLASDRARRRGAPREASTHLEHALALVGGLAHPADRRRHERRLRLARAPLLLDLFGPASTALLDNCERALRLCDRDGDAREHFDLLHARAYVHVTRSEEARAISTVRSLQTLARETGSNEQRVLADSSWCYVATLRGDFAGGAAAADEVRRMLRERQVAVTPIFGIEPAVGIECYDALCSWMSGRTEQARAAVRNGYAAADAPDTSPFSRAHPLFFDSLLALFERDPPRVLATCDTLLQLAEEHDLRLWLIITPPLRGWARIQLGDVRGGIEEIERARLAHRASDTAIFATFMLAFLAEGQLRADAPEAARETIDEALHLAETTLERCYHPELWRLKGEVLLAAGGDPSHAAAEACLERALDMARVSQAHGLGLRAANSLARLWLASGRGDAARRVVAEALDRVDSAETADYREARALVAPPARKRIRPNRHR